MVEEKLLRKRILQYGEKYYIDHGMHNDKVTNAIDDILQIVDSQPKANSLITVLWYNGFEDEMTNLIRYLESCKESKQAILPKDWYQLDANHPMRLLWGVLVMEYGDYGTSPRSGWIDDFSCINILKEELEG